MDLTDEIRLELQDNEWKFEYADHDRQIARAIVFDDLGYFYFVRAIRDDDFGKATLIETSGGGVEPGEELTRAIRRELKEELGIEVDIVCKIGVVSDYYNLIHRHNINNYFLCKVLSFGEKNLTKDEIESFHLSTLKMTFEDAVKEYEKCSNTKIGRLVANRELPILQRAKQMIDTIAKMDTPMIRGNKIIVLGCPGSGKSTFAAKLHLHTGIPLIHLDNVWWKPDRTHITRDEFDQRLEMLMSADEWIIDGNYSRTYEMRMQACDVIIFLDYSEADCMNGIKERVGKQRADMPWVEQELDPELVALVQNYRDENRPVILELLEKYPNKQKIIFQTRAQADDWLADFSAHRL
jgi:adenylate kinase family enzyme/8-oxo-dGTP pyrophosphatase MutT (NUDIX family)